MAEISAPARRPIRFSSFELDPKSGELRKAGVVVGLQDQSLKVLVELLERPGDLVTREQLRQRLWPNGTFVDFEHGLNAIINRLRETLGDSAESPRFIQTVPRRGYRFIAPVDDGVEVLVTAPPPRPLESRKWMVVGAAGIVLVLAAVALFYGLRSSPRGSMRTIPLTSLPGKETHPSFSPDGGGIAFSWDGEKGDNEDIYVKVIGTELPLRLTTNPARDRDPAWSGDGRQIAFVRSSAEGSGLFVIPALGGPERKIQSLTTLDGWSTAPSWSPDGEILAFAEVGRDSTSRIAIVSIKTLEKRTLTSPPPGSVGDDAPAFSPDGRSIAFNRVSPNSGIHVVATAGGDPRRVTQEHHLWLQRLAWTPSGDELVFSSGLGAPESSSALWRVSAAGGRPERLAVGGDNAANPAVSPRGERLAYEQRQMDANIWKIALPQSTQPGSSPSQLIASTRYEAGPQFSPDGARIAFHSDRTGSNEIWLCDATGSNLIQLTSFGGALVGTPRWAPDGRRLVFDVAANGNSDIHVIDVEGGLSRRVTSEPSAEVVPSWSRDGRWIYFASNRTGRPEVWKMPSAGGDVIRITKRGGFAAFESSDGQYLYYAKGLESDGVWKVAVGGGEEAEVIGFPKAGFWGYWALVDAGLYFVDTESRPQPALKFLRFAGHQVEHVAALERLPVPFEPGIAASPDGRWILYTQEDHRSGDIMLVENFH